MSNIFRKKKDESFLIEAEQYNGKNDPFGALRHHQCNYRMCPLCGGDDHVHKYIESIPGPIIVKIGDYVVRHPNGFFDTVGKDRFEKIYKLEFIHPTKEEEIPEEIESVLKNLARSGWQFARNAHRLYPDNKHTFSDYSATTLPKDLEPAIARYHKMQEEIQEYRKALQEIDDKVLAYRKIHGDSPAGNHCRNIAMETLAKYPNS